MRGCRRSGSRGPRSEPDSSPSRRAAKLCRPASIVVRSGGPLTSGRVLQLAHQPAARGDLDPRRAGPAAQPLLHHLLEAFLADLEAGRDQQRVAVLRLIFLAVGGADIADQMADRGAFRIEAGEGAQRRDAGQLGQAHVDRGDISRTVRCSATGTGWKPAAALELVADPRDLVGRRGRGSGRARRSPGRRPRAGRG